MAKPTAKNAPRGPGSEDPGDKQRELQREQDRKDQAKAKATVERLDKLPPNARNK